MSTLIDNETILSENEQWKKLEEEWGKPIDLEVDAEDDTPGIQSAYSTLDLKGTTFDSSFLFKKVRRKIGRRLSRKSTSSALEYNDFISNLKDDPSRESSKQFYFINGQLISAASIENICDTIDDIFKSIDKLSTVTSTVRKEKFPEKVQCSISATDLSFDSDTEDTKYSEIERHIEEAFEGFNSLSGMDAVDQSTMDSVTTLVQKFSSVLKDPVIQCSPRRRRQCCDKFKELADFWKNRAFECDN